MVQKRRVVNGTGLPMTMMMKKGPIVRSFSKDSMNDFWTRGLVLSINGIKATLPYNVAMLLVFWALSPLIAIRMIS